MDADGVRALVRRHDEGLVWLDLDGDDDNLAELLAVIADELDIHVLVTEDMTNAHQRAKLDRFRGVTFAVLRPARWLVDQQRAEIGELHVVSTKNVVVTITRGFGPDLAAIRADLETTPELLVAGNGTVLYAILDAVIDDYAPVVIGLETAVDEVENAVFDGQTGAARRIYRLMRQVIEVDRATEPLPAMIEAAKGLAGDNVELGRRMDNLDDHVSRLVERVEAFRTLLRHALEVNSILVGENHSEEVKRLTEASLAQGEQVKRISSWAAILFAPTLVASVYGMNFDYMPELQWRLGYPFAVVLMVALGALLYRAFRRRGWL